MEMSAIVFRCLTKRMTTVEFGGGPTCQARREFANLKEGGEIPKYAGHIHQLRFRQGHTFTEETHRLSLDFPQLLRRSRSSLPGPDTGRSDSEGRIPGYAGYIPQRKFQHGHRYRVETDACSASATSSYENQKHQARRLRETISAYPKTEHLNSATVVKHFLDYHRALYPNESSQQEDRRSFVEAPMPGYRGYVPRMRPIGVGVGSRYHEATRKSLARFALETSSSTTNLPAAVEEQPPLDRSLTSVSPLNFSRQRPVSMPSTHRIYQQSGMIPRYTGYLPQRKYRVGQTFGDTTRGLPVCSLDLN